MRINNLTSTIIGTVITVQKTLGPGLLESAYRVCLAYELQKLGLHVEVEQPIPVVYDEVKLECGFLRLFGALLLINKFREKI